MVVGKERRRCPDLDEVATLRQPALVHVDGVKKRRMGATQSDAKDILRHLLVCSYRYSPSSLQVLLVVALAGMSPDCEVSQSRQAPLAQSVIRRAAHVGGTTLRITMAYDRVPKTSASPEQTAGGLLG